ncbi:MAG: super-infection exclusion protein B [Vampirovibrionales bacterium]
MEPATTAILKNLFDYTIGAKNIRFFIVLFLLTAFLLFAPIDIKKTLVLEAFCHSYQTYISLVFCGSFLYVIVHLGNETSKILKIFWNDRKAYQNQENVFESLSLNEKKVIVQYIVSKEKVHTFPYNDRVIASLQQKSILAPSVSTGDMYEFPFTIREWAQKIGEEYRDLFIKETVDSEGNFYGYKSDSKVPPSLLQRQFIFSSPQNID